MMSLDDFEEICQSQAIGYVHNPKHITRLEACGVPTAMLGKVVELGRIATDNPDYKLAQVPLEITPSIAQDVGARAVAYFINGSLRACDDPSLLSFPSSPRARVGYCAAVEPLFTRTFRQLFEEPVTPPHMWGGQIIVNDKNEPIALRKSYSQQSAITFQDLIIGGRRCLAGSIIGFDTRTSSIPNTGFSVMPASKMPGVAFKRLSGYAFDPLERPIFYRQWYDYGRSNNAEFDFYKTTTLDGLCEATKTALGQLTDD